jgi:hypothetical protein
MQNCSTLSEIIQVHDIPVLKFLTDVRITSTAQQENIDADFLDFR